MSAICLVSYEIHPTTWGGCGVLLHHAAEHLLAAGHTVLFLLDVPVEYFHRFRDQDRLALSRPENCRAYHVDTLCEDFPYAREQVGEAAVWGALRFGHAYHRLARMEHIDFVEFVEYCGIGYYSMARRVYGEDADGPVLGQRLHNSIELIDHHGATRCLDRGRYLLYGLERAAMDLAEAVLTPTQTYYEHYYRDAYRLRPERIAVSQSPKLGFPRVTRRPAPRGRFTIVHLGRLFQFKGVYQLVLAAVALMHLRPELDFKVELIGPDSAESPFGTSYIEYLKTLIPADLRSRFVFTGHLPHAEVAERLNSALFGVFPNRFESFCYAVHELYDAGVPVVVSHLPGWADFFKHRENALIYDGTTQGLLDAMNTMIDDDDLRESLCRPFPIADHPLGDFYDRPRPLSRIAVADPPAAEFKAIIVVLCPAGEVPTDAPAYEALEQQTYRRFDTVFLIPAGKANEALTWWLGRAWRASDAAGRPLPLSEMLAADAIAMLRHSDRPDRDWLQHCARALQRRPNMAFAGTWLRSGEKLTPLYLDIAPELYPFEHGSARTRTLVRTHPQRLLVDLLDPNLGNLGEVGLIWQAVAKWGRGCLSPSGEMAVADGLHEPLDMNLLHYLLARYGQPFQDRLRILTGLLKDELASAREAGAQLAAQKARLEAEQARLEAEQARLQGELADEQQRAAQLRAGLEQRTREVEEKTTELFRLEGLRQAHERRWQQFLARLNQALTLPARP